jgi:hypothetical protein
MEVEQEHIDIATEHNQQIGFLCSQWSYLEWNLEVAIWWLLGNLPQSDGRVTTGGIDICSLARKVRELAHREITAQADLDALDDLKKRLEKAVDERNLAIHGLREVGPNNTVLGTVTRGPYKNKPQKTTTRLKSINAEVGRLIAIIEPLLVKYGVVEGMTLTAQDGLAERSRAEEW